MSADTTKIIRRPRFAIVFADTTKIIRRPRFAIVFASVPGRGDLKKQIKNDNSVRGEAIGRLLRWQPVRRAIEREIDLGHWKGRSSVLRGMGHDHR